MAQLESVFPTEEEARKLLHALIEKGCRASRHHNLYTGGSDRRSSYVEFQCAYTTAHARRDG